VPGWVIGGEEDGFAIVGEGYARPVWFRVCDFLGGHGGAHVKCRKWGFIVVSQIVKQDTVGGGGGDCDHGGRGVVGR